MNTVTDFMLAGDGYSDLAVLVVKTTLIVGLGLIGWKSLGWASASARHLVLGATLVAAILLPLIAAVMPPLNLHVLAPPVQNSAMATATAELPSAGQTISPATDTFARSNPSAARKPAPSILLLIYLAGVFLIAARLMTGLMRVAWITRRSAPADDSPLWELPADTPARLQLRTTDRLEAPLTWGFVRPVILLPESGNGWTEQDRRNALLHELAHIERRDWLTQILASLVCTAYWFNPLVWLARRQLVLEAELAADDRVLDAGSTAEDYAEQLVALTQRTRSPRRYLAATTMAEQGHLRRRIRSILNPGEQRMPMNQTGQSLLLSTIAAAALLIGATELVAAPQDADAGAAATDIPAEVATPLIRAAASGDNDEVRRLLQAGADPNETWQGSRMDFGNEHYDSERHRYNLRRTALNTAASRGHRDVVESLLDAGVQVDAVADGDPTALIEALTGNHDDVARLLVQRGADANKAVRGDGSPLIAAAKRNNTDMMRRLLELGADPNLWVRGDENPLFHAARNGNAEAVRLLIDAGVDVNQEWRGDGTPLMVATRSGDQATIDLLIQSGADVNAGVKGDGNAMIIAARRGDNDMLRKMLEAGADPNAAVKGDGSPLIQAARNGNMDGVVMLLAAGADIDMVVRGDENALIGAAWQGDVEMVDYLLKSGADPNIRARSGFRTRTALRQAQKGGHDEVIRMLEAAGATE